MKIKECLELGKTFGLRTVGEAYINGTVHISLLLNMENIPREVDELTEEYDKLCSNGSIHSETMIEKALKIIL